MLGVLLYDSMMFLFDFNVLLTGLIDTQIASPVNDDTKNFEIVTIPFV